MDWFARLCLPLALSSLSAHAINVYSHRYDNAHSGVNAEETQLTPESVSHHFGKLFELPVEGRIYAQPLYVGGRVIVATMKNYIYAFAGDKAGPYLWRTYLGLPEEVHSAHSSNQPVADFVGVLSTPYVDVTAGVIYVVSLDMREDRGVYRLHKLDLETGHVLQAVELGGRLGAIEFESGLHLQRVALQMHKGFIHVAFGGLGDRTPFHGWIMSYRASDLVGGPSFVSSPVALGDTGAGIWQSGHGLTVDDQGYVYLATGNGDFNPAVGDYGNSLLKLDFHAETGLFSVVDFFTPYDQAVLNDLDLDVGSAGVQFIPPHFLVGAGKTGKFYILDRDHLGGYTPEANGDAGAIQVLQATEPSWKKIVDNTFMWNIHGAPVQWRGTLFVMGESDPVKAFAMDLTSGRVGLEPVSRSSFTAPVGAMPGGFVAVSANGLAPRDSAIVWVVHPFSGNAVFSDCPGILHALDARDLSHELWNSYAAAGDDFGLFAKFVHPVVADGRVYMATFSNKVVVYGLR